jgi:hypothetical protein
MKIRTYDPDRVNFNNDDGWMLLHGFSARIHTPTSIVAVVVLLLLLLYQAIKLIGWYAATSLVV